MSAFQGVAEAYRRSFATLCTGAAPALLTATSPGSTHLDVGCGTGDLAVAAAQEGRRVLAVDPDPGMVALTVEAATTASVELEVLEAGAPGLPYPDSAAEAVTANFVINHVVDPRASLRDLARVAAPSAPIGMTIWPSTPGPHLRAYAEASRAAGAVPVSSTHLAPELDFPRTVDGLADLSREVGLSVERAEELHWVWHIPADELLAGIRGGVAGPGRSHLAQTPAAREDIEERVRELWRVHGVGDGVLAFPVTALLVVASRP